MTECLMHLTTFLNNFGGILALADSMRVVGLSSAADDLYFYCKEIEKARENFIEAWTSNVHERFLTAQENSASVLSALVAGMEKAESKR